MQEFYRDAQTGQLPAVSYIAPGGLSEHPPGKLAAGQTFVRSIVNELMRSPEWSSTAFVLTYDSWGGWYDHVAPPAVDRYGYGFRVPALLVSPYAKRGSIDHATLDFTSILRFIEDNWSLAPLARRDADASSIASAFDFAAAPRGAAFVSADRTAQVRRDGAYAGGLLVLRRRVPARVRADRRSARQRTPTPDPRYGGGTVKRLAIVLAPLLLALAAVPGGAAAAERPGVVRIRTVPAVSGLVFTFHGRRFRTDANGRVAIPAAAGVASDAVLPRIRVYQLRLDPDTKVRFARWFSVGNVSVAALDVFRRVGWRFVDAEGAPIPTTRIERVVLRSTSGAVEVLRTRLDEPRWLFSRRVSLIRGHTALKNVNYALQRVTVLGADVVNAGQQTFSPEDQQAVKFKLAFFTSPSAARMRSSGRRAERERGSCSRTGTCDHSG